MLYSPRIAVSAHCNRSLKFSRNNFIIRFFLLGKSLLIARILRYILEYIIYAQKLPCSSNLEGDEYEYKIIHIIHGVSNIVEI